MSWQKYSVQLVLGFPLSLPIVAYAVNIGDTYVQTQQNQPLNASINVSDINPRTFSVTVAQADVYRQLGLSKDADIQIKFLPTSSNGGQIVLTTKRAINAPFTDVVLNITENGVTKTLPKTLLMPIDSAQKITTQANTTALQSPAQNIVIGSANPVQLPVMSPDPIPMQPITLPSTTINQLPNLPTTGMPAGAAPMTQASENSDYLRIQETRTVRSVQPNGAVYTQAVPQTQNPIQTNAADNQLPSPAASYGNQPLDKSKSKYSAKNRQIIGETTTYTLQRNDNLWTIASNIAAANRKDVDQVMADIMAANPTAFPGNDPTKLVANTQLQIPKYKVVPSQIGIKSANKARQQYRQNKKRIASKKFVIAAKSAAKQPATLKTTKKTLKAQKTPRPYTATKKSEMTIIAPNHTNGSVQGQSTKNKVGKGMSSQVAAQVQQKRQATAQQATKVNKLNQDLVGAENRLKIQNTKLAQLEKRLKELNKK
ncbi:FimV family protein [Moraxella sp. 179-F 1C4 NHS]